MGSVGDSKEDLSFYKTNIILEEKNNTFGKKSEPSLNGKQTEKDKEPSKPDENVPPIAFFSMYKYSNWGDKFLYFLGFVCALATGASTCLNSLIFGNLADNKIFSATGPWDPLFTTSHFWADEGIYNFMPIPNG